MACSWSAASGQQACCLFNLSLITVCFPQSCSPISGDSRHTSTARLLSDWPAGEISTIQATCFHIYAWSSFVWGLFSHLWDLTCLGVKDVMVMDPANLLNVARLLALDQRLTGPEQTIMLENWGLTRESCTLPGLHASSA